MNILHKTSNDNGIFYYEVNGEVLAECTYFMTGTNQMVIDHTEVDSSLKGQGVGLALIRAAADYARLHHFKIFPECEFAKAMFNKHSEFNDIIYRL